MALPRDFLHTKKGNMPNLLGTGATVLVLVKVLHPFQTILKDAYPNPDKHEPLRDWLLVVMGRRPRRLAPSKNTQKYALEFCANPIFGLEDGKTNFKIIVLFGYNLL